MPSPWDAAADRDLLLAIIEDGKLQTLDWRSIASKMAVKNHTFTHEACRQHYQKLRRESATGTGSAPSTPSRAVNGTKKTKTPGSRKSAKKVLDDNRDDEENEDPDTPSKKRKRFAKKEEADLGGLEGQTALQFKMESLSSEEDGAINLEEEDNYV